MKPPRVPDLRKLLAGLAAARADGEVPALEEQLEELERRLQCRARESRERRLRKVMGPPEPPERALSLRAMEQIRFLRSAFPEEWPAGRLAQGFGVTPEVIRRVLKSRFRPSPERGQKQDARAHAPPLHQQPDWGKPGGRGPPPPETPAQEPPVAADGPGAPGAERATPGRGRPLGSGERGGPGGLGKRERRGASSSGADSPPAGPQTAPTRKSPVSFLGGASVKTRPGFQGGKGCSLSRVGGWGHFRKE